jgi:hypothetical protein
VLLVKLFDSHGAAWGVDVFSFEDGPESATADIIGDLIITNASTTHKSPL